MSKVSFGVFYPAWQEWCEKIAEQTKYGGNLSALEVAYTIHAMTELGFIIVPPNEQVHPDMIKQERY